MSETQFDLIVVGGGPGGYVAAIRGAQLGMNVAVVEREHMGGICLNWGCIPTKALLRSSEINHLMHNAEDYGFKISEIEFDFNKIIERSRAVSKQLSSGVTHLMKKNKIPIFDAHAALDGPGKLVLSNGKDAGKTLTAPHIILATGARARQLPGLEADEKLIWTYKKAMTPDQMPKSLLVVGSGAIGSEFASFYQNMGVNVTLVEVVDRILPVEDAEISAFVQKSFEKDGMTVLTNAMVKALDKGEDEVTATIEQNGEQTQHRFDRVIMAVGIVGNSDNIGLETTKVQTDRGHIVTDGYGRTNEPGIYAIGDVTGAPWLAHKASHEGVICVEKIANHPNVHPMKKENIPGCTYCRPQVASVGLTAEKAQALGHRVKVGKFPFMANGKAIALGEPEGFIKTVFDEKTGELLGAHMVGAEVTELIQGYTIAKTNELTESELMHTVFPHPTLSEMMHEAVLDAYGKVIHF